MVCRICECDAGSKLFLVSVDAILHLGKVLNVRTRIVDADVRQVLSSTHTTARPTILKIEAMALNWGGGAFKANIKRRLNLVE